MDTLTARILPSQVWRRPRFYVLLFWLCMALSFYLDVHLPRQYLGRPYVFLNQLMFMLTAAGYLCWASPGEPDRRLTGLQAALLVFLSWLPVPAYLWYWYGLRRALEFVGMACLCILLFSTLLWGVDQLLPGTFS